MRTAVPPAKPHACPRVVPLTQLPRGCCGVVAESAFDADDAEQLRCMGLRPSAEIRVCRMGEPCIVALRDGCGLGCRIGLSRKLAERLMVATAG